MPDKTPSLNGFCKIEAKRVRVNWVLLSGAIKHAGKKGRTMERQDAAPFLREFIKL